MFEDYIFRIITVSSGSKCAQENGLHDKAFYNEAKN